MELQTVSSLAGSTISSFPCPLCLFPLIREPSCPQHGNEYHKAGEILEDEGYRDCQPPLLLLSQQNPVLFPPASFRSLWRIPKAEYSPRREPAKPAPLSPSESPWARG